MTTNPDVDIDVDFENTWTFATDSDGDILFNELNTVPTVEGDRAIVQDLKVALATIKEEDPLDEAFGLDVFTATRSVPFLKREIRRTLLHDDKLHDRVESVPEVDVYRLQNRRARVEVLVRLDTDEEMTLSMAFGGIF